MKINMKTLLVATLAAATLFVMTPMASAQRGQGGGFRMMQGGGGSFTLLRRNDVQKDLKLTDDQKTKLTDLQAKMRTDMQAMFQNGQGGDREAMMKEMQEKMAGYQKESDAILTADQRTRLDQINVQIQGNRIVLDPKWQDKLKLTDDQKSKIKDLQTKQQEANQSLFQKMQNGEIEREELQASMQKNNVALDAELGKILTDDQRKMLADAAGPKFDRDPADDAPRRGGGGRGGR